MDGKYSLQEAYKDYDSKEKRVYIDLYNRFNGKEKVYIQTEFSAVSLFYVAKELGQRQKIYRDIKSYKVERAKGFQCMWKCTMIICPLRWEDMENKIRIRWKGDAPFEILESCYFRSYIGGLSKLEEIV